MPRHGRRAGVHEPELLRGRRVKTFFDKALLTKRLDPATKRALVKFGKFVRVAAKSSIRPGGKSNAKSAPGEPPRSHTGVLRKMMLYALDDAVKSVVIGPALTGRKNVAAVLEYGGQQAAGTARAARPYMRPAFERQKASIADLFRDLLTKG